jgi:hypothetical protein
MKHNELEMQKQEVPQPKTREELDKYIDYLVEGQHDYGTCVYAMSMAATATFYYISHKLGVTGFQASCADLDILRRLRHIECFSVQNMDNLLYPQYCNEEHFPSWEQLLQKHKEWLKEKATKLLKKEESYAHPSVVAHWKMLSEL